MNRIAKWVYLDSCRLVVDGKEIETTESGKELLTQLYRKYVNDYPKFFKMDPLCRLGLVASELLMKGAIENENGDEYSIILFNKSGSLANDKLYQGTIDESNYYPSPAVFVYTLPNIVTGEIAIRHRIHGESSFYVLDDVNATMIRSIVGSSFETSTKGIVCGWLECSSENEFKAALFIVDKTSATDFTEEEINRIINYKQ